MHREAEPDQIKVLLRQKESIAQQRIRKLEEEVAELKAEVTARSRSLLGGTKAGRAAAAGRRLLWRMLGRAASARRCVARSEYRPQGRGGPLPPTRRGWVVDHVADVATTLCWATLMPASLQTNRVASSCPVLLSASRLALALVESGRMCPRRGMRWLHGVGEFDNPRHVGW